MPHKAFSLDLRLELKSAILVMHRMIVPAGEKRPE
jgi:hypothetical protein